MSGSATSRKIKALLFFHSLGHDAEPLSDVGRDPSHSLPPPKPENHLPRSTSGRSCSPTSSFVVVDLLSPCYWSKPNTKRASKTVIEMAWPMEKKGGKGGWLEA